MHFKEYFILTTDTPWFPKRMGLPGSKPTLTRHLAWLNTAYKQSAEGVLALNRTISTT